ncbi:unnamed protein product [Thelazia callipaeda]|uniref:Heat shock factor-binding protein 1 n=1 Tax=Thelazia callipaeda TaxID=103827 RepID=A0A0N5CJR7_THECL|nr:unnamed protein product [Thelazia callipaeda]
MDSDQQQNNEKIGEETLSKKDENDLLIMQDIKSGDQSLLELSSLIQGVLQQTQDRFQRMSDQIIGRIDDMTKRIDELEKNITDLMTQAGVEPEL